jgi:Domain of unknown function (DUF4105)
MKGSPGKTVPPSPPNVQSTLWLRRTALALEIVIALLATLWAAGALYFDGPFPAWRWLIALLYLVAVLAALIFLRRRQRVLIVAFAVFALTVFWWLGIKPSNQRDWKPDNLYTAYAQVNGNQIILRNVRNCEYRTEEDYACRWETRSFNLASLRGADVFITWWGSPWIAHPIVSFDFGQEGHVAISIGTRDMVGQSYSALRGFFRQYTLAYTVSDERDVIRLRTNYRKDEEVYLFRTTADPALARQIFLDYLTRVNSLHQKPEWYNALTNNCTTNIAVSVAEARHQRARHDWRILLNGKMDEMMYERGVLITGGLPLDALKYQAHINAEAKAANEQSDFSALIRNGRIGFAEDGSQK